MSQPDEAFQWHGWSSENTALFLSPHPDGEHVALFIQRDRSTDMLGVFMDPVTAQDFQDWMDGVLAAQASANAELLARLQEEQPLLFQPTTAPEDPDETEEP